MPWVVSEGLSIYVGDQKFSVGLEAHRSMMDSGRSKFSVARTRSAVLFRFREEIFDKCPHYHNVNAIADEFIF